MSFTYTPFNIGDSASSVRTLFNSVGVETAALSNILNVSLGVVGTNVSVATTAWIASTVYENFTYEAVIPLTGTLATDIPFVMLSPTDQESGAFIGSDATTNGVIIYTNAIPESAITIPLVFTLRDMADIVMPVTIDVTTPPTKVTYNVGETINLTGMVVTATYSDGTTANVTSQCTYMPASGVTVTSDMTHIIVTWVNQGATFRTNQLIFVGVRQYTAGYDQALVDLLGGEQ